jgi:hypothetical protein
MCQLRCVKGKRGQFSGVPMSSAIGEDDKNDIESAACQIDDHRFVAFLNFLVRRPVKNKVTVYS